MSVDNDYKEKILDLLKTILNISDEINKKNLNNKHKEWDSLRQLSIVFALEEEFNINLSNKEITYCTNYFDICDIIGKKLK